MSEDQFEKEMAEEEGIAQEISEAAEVAEEVAEPETVAKEQYDSIHQAMDRERHEKKELQQQFTDYKSGMEEKFARVDERLTTLNKMWGTEDEVDPEVKQQEALAAQQKENADIREQLNIINLQNTLNSQEAQFSAQTPDYNEAKNHYFSTRLNSLGKLGYSQEQAQNQIAMETMQFSQTALSQNENAASRLYDAAKELGYIPVTAKAEERIEAIKEGQDVGTIPKGSPPKGELTMETLAKMTDAEFATLTPEQIRTAQGG